MAKRAGDNKASRKRLLDENGWQSSSDPDVMLHFLGMKVSKRKRRLFAAACCRLVWGFMIEPVSRQAVERAELVADEQLSEVEQVEVFQLADEVAQSLHGVFVCGGVDVPGSNFAAIAAAATVAPKLLFEYTDGEETARRRFQPWHAAVLAVAREAREHTNHSFPLGDEDEDNPSQEWYDQQEEACEEVWLTAYHAGRAEQCAILRDLFNPFRRRSKSFKWRTSTVTALAEAAYEERFLPVGAAKIPKQLTIPQIAERSWKRAWPAGHLDHARLAILADALEEADCSDSALLDHLRSPGPHVRGCWALDLVLGKV